MFGPLHFSTLAVSIYDVWGPHPWIDIEVLEPLENPSGLQVSRCAAFFDRLWAQKTVPFAIHGDGAEFHRHSEYFVMSWTSAFITGGGENCLVSRYPISLVAEAQMADDRDPWLRFMHKRTNNENPQLISGILRLVFNPASSVVDLKTGLLWWDSLVVKDRKKHCKIRVSFFPFNPTRKWGSRRGEQNFGWIGGLVPPMCCWRAVPWPWVLWWRVSKKHLQV